MMQNEFKAHEEALDRVLSEKCEYCGVEYRCCLRSRIEGFDPCCPRCSHTKLED